MQPHAKNVELNICNLIWYESIETQMIYFLKERGTEVGKLDWHGNSTRHLTEKKEVFFPILRHERKKED